MTDSTRLVFPAHIKFRDGQAVVQNVETHCRHTAELVRKHLEPVGLGQAGYLVGLLHDCGKFTKAFDKYIWKIVIGEDVNRGSVNHTFAGVKFLLENYYCVKDSGNNLINNLACEILCFAAGSHHRMFDFIDDDKKSGLLYRQSKTDIFYEEVVENIYAYLADKSEIDKLFQSASKEIGIHLNTFRTISRDLKEFQFHVGFMCRLILSAVIEGDRTDTVTFMKDINESDIYADLDWSIMLSALEKELDRLPCNTEIGKARKMISEKCCDRATEPPGIYRLNVPTAGGKTLSSLRYALKHAQLFNKKRIFYITPFFSIIEQKAKVIRDFVQNGDFVLEYHSNLVDVSESEFLDSKEFLAEKWDAPITVTSLVQILDVMFKDRITCVRKFHHLCDSVVIFDEVQAIPAKLLSLFNLACNFLSKVCNCTIVLCSATQPCFEKIDHPLVDGVGEFITLDKDVLSCFDRTDIVDFGRMEIPDIVSFAEKTIEKFQSLLIVCNTRAEAGKIYDKISVDGVEKIYLSANMCGEHRNNVIQNMKIMLQNGKKIICVSTRLIEAVDISFACAVRLKTGIDSIIQTAGRCNRNRETEEKSPVYVIELLGERLSRLPDIDYAKKATTSLFVKKELTPGFGNLMSDEAISFYYNRLYKIYSNSKYGYHDFYCKKDNFYILDKISVNSKFCSYNTGFLLSQALKSAGKVFEVFEDGTRDILVPYKEGEKVIADICSERAGYDFGFLKKRLKAAENYIVRLYGYQIDKLIEIGALKKIEELNLYALSKGNYDPRTGVVFK